MSGGVVGPVRQPSLGALRQRRDAANRPGLSRISTRANTADAVDNPYRTEPPPLVRTPGYILKKFRGYPPSLIVHLHPNNFRFDQQDGNFAYNSPIGKTFMKHLKDRTVPHDLMEEFFASGVPFYEGCLIVECHNHRSSGLAQSATTNQVGGSSSDPFNIHNSNEHITPSPFIKMPELLLKEASADEAKAAFSNGTSNAQESAVDKENMPAPGHALVSTNPQVKAPTVMATVLFPTPLTLDTEIRILTNTPYDENSAKRLSIAQDGQSSGLPHPPTPLTSVPTTPILGQLPNPNKKRKTLLDAFNVKEFEAQVLKMTEPVLYLESAKDFNHSQDILEALRCPLNNASPPKPKTRKRTIAEVAAEEAEAAKEEKFILNFDERQSTGLGSGNGAAAATAEAQASSEFNFKRFKTLEQIKLKHVKLDQEKKEKEARNHALAKQQQAQQEETKKREREREQQVRDQQKILAQAAKAKREQMEAKQKAELLQKQQAQAEFNAQQNQMRKNQIQQHMQQQAQQNGANPGTPNSQQMAMATSAISAPGVTASHMSPIIRHHTPMNGSPSLDGNNMTMNMTSVPMMTTSSNQGAGSPGVSMTAAQQAHAHAMARTMSQQPGHVSASANGTPQMMSTPSMGTAGPAAQRMTPQPRMQGSPVPGQLQSTQMILTPSQGGQSLTPEQQQRQMQLFRQQQMRTMTGGQMNIPNMQNVPNMQSLQNMQTMQNLQNMQSMQSMQGRQLTPQQIQQVHQMQARQAQMRIQQQSPMQHSSPMQQGHPATIVPFTQLQGFNNARTMLEKMRQTAQTSGLAPLQTLAMQLTNKFKEVDMNIKAAATERANSFVMQYPGNSCPPDDLAKFREADSRVMDSGFQQFVQQATNSWQQLTQSIRHRQSLMNQPGQGQRMQPGQPMRQGGQQSHLTGLNNYAQQLQMSQMQMKAQATQQQNMMMQGNMAVNMQSGIQGNMAASMAGNMQNLQGMQGVNGMPNMQNMQMNGMQMQMGMPASMQMGQQQGGMQGQQQHHNNMGM